MIIQDFHFNEYPIVREYFLGGQKVVQIDNPHLKAIQDLEESIEQNKTSLDEEEKLRKKLERKIGELERELDDKDQEIDSAFSALEQFCVYFPGIKEKFEIDASKSLAHNICLAFETIAHS